MRGLASCVARGCALASIILIHSRITDMVLTIYSYTTIFLFTIHHLHPLHRRCANCVRQCARNAGREHKGNSAARVAVQMWQGASAVPEQMWQRWSTGWQTCGLSGATTRRPTPSRTAGAPSRRRRGRFPHYLAATGRRVAVSALDRKGNYSAVTDANATV